MDKEQRQEKLVADVKNISSDSGAVEDDDGAKAAITCQYANSFILRFHL